MPFFRPAVLLLATGVATLAAAILEAKLAQAEEEIILPGVRPILLPDGRPGNTSKRSEQTGAGEANGTVTGRQKGLGVAKDEKSRETSAGCVGIGRILGLKGDASSVAVLALRTWAAGCRYEPILSVGDGAPHRHEPATREQACRWDIQLLQGLAGSNGKEVAEETLSVAYGQLLSDCPEFSAEIKPQADALGRSAEAHAWQRALRTNTKDAFADFLDSFPRSSHATDAQKRQDRAAAIEEARAEVEQSRVAAESLRAAWRTARAENTAAAYQAFLEQYGNSAYALEARARLKRSKAMVVLEYPKSVRATAAPYANVRRWFHWGMTFREVGGNVGFTVEAGCTNLYDAKGTHWVSKSCGGRKIRVRPGQKVRESDWVGAEDDFAGGGKKSVTWTGTDDRGNSVQVTEEVELLP